MYKNIPTQHIRHHSFDEQDISIDVLRLDLLDPEVSGNKWFKLRYYVEDALALGKTGIISVGGAYSNHLVALARVCRDNRLISAAIIRGEAPVTSNPSLEQMASLGMQLLFVSRSEYAEKDRLLQAFLNKHPHYYAIPEGGRSAMGVRGASTILDAAMRSPSRKYTHVACAVGTGTTLAGIANSLGAEQRALGLCSFRGDGPAALGILDFLAKHAIQKNHTVVFDYGFGGFGKKSDELTGFMNTLYETQQIPTDFVYTGKLFYGLYDLAGSGYFRQGSQILIIHSGGLQGNRSLAPGTLNY